MRTIDFRHKLDEINDSISRLENENKVLLEAIRSYRSEDYQIEKIAREDLGMAKKNEVIIKIVRDEKVLSPLPEGGVEPTPQ